MSGVCRDCGTELALTLLACPACGSLVHSEELKRLVGNAQNAATHAEALAAWRQALTLLPAGTRQAEVVLGKIGESTKALDRDEPMAPKQIELPAQQPQEESPAKARPKGLAGGLAAVGALALKFKFAVFFLLTKAKILLLGLTKASTFFSMMLSFSVYWGMWGWKFAAGIVLSIYVHEMGHVAMLRRFGIRATAPMFIPGFGAMVRLKEALPTSLEDARVGLAGPIWGLGAAFAAYAFSLAFHSPFFAAIAKLGAWINLFNLMPIWQLDGARAFRSLSRPQRWVTVVVLLAAFAFSREHLLLLLLVVAVMRAFDREAAAEPDQRALFEYCFLVVTLSALTMVPSLPQTMPS